MFAILAAILFLLELIDVSIGTLNLVVAGFLSLAIHLAYPVGPWYTNRRVP